MNRSDLSPLKKFTESDSRPSTHSLSLAMHRTKSEFPKQEPCGLMSRIERYGASAPSNGAEGWNRRPMNEILRHIPLTNGSSYELRCFLILTTDLEFGSRDDITEPDSDVDRNSAMIVVLNRPPKKRQEG